MQEKSYTATMTNSKLLGCTEFEVHTIEITIDKKTTFEVHLN